jgi:hypothetical protein
MSLPTMLRGTVRVLLTYLPIESSGVASTGPLCLTKRRCYDHWLCNRVIGSASSNQPQRWCMRQRAEKWRPLNCGDKGSGDKTRETNAIHYGSPLTKVVVKTRVQ